MFSSTFQKNSFWVSLIEKAYAKLHLCYEALIYGIPEDAVMDLTGFPLSQFLLQENGKFPSRKLGGLVNYWEYLKKVQADT